jgi:thiol:disulfide interchange protein DsbC
MLLLSCLFAGVLVVGVTAKPAVAATPSAPDSAVVPADSMALIKGRLQGAFNAEPDAIADAPLAGFYEVVYGSQVFYVSTDARHLISGELYDLATLENLTEQRRAGGRLKIMEGIAESSMIVYRAKDEKHVINVFTDVDCVYCRKLHQDMAQLNELGITVRYLAFPRAGVDSSSYDKMVSIWCAKDRNRAMDEAKGSGKIKPLKCDTPVLQHMAVGQQLGISGTPGLILEDGRLQPGYSPPAQLLTLFK